MTCEELRDDYDLYALGIGEEPERSALRDHLRRDCPNCTPGVRRSFLLAAQMSSLAKTAEPPGRLRRRILAIVNPEVVEPTPKKGFGWSLVWMATSVALLAVALLLGWQARRLGELRRTETAQLQSALAVLTAPSSREVTFGTADHEPPRGRVVVNRERGVVVVASNLPPVEPGKACELWLIPQGGKPIPSGMFRPGDDGTGIVIRAGKVPDNLGVVAVTVENEAGVDAPTSKPIIAAAVATPGA